MEVLVAFVIAMAIMVAVFEMVSGIEHSWRTVATGPFQEAEHAFTVVTENLADATLEPYQDYANATGSFNVTGTGSFTADHLARRSDLAFVCGPCASTDGLLTSSGRNVAGCGVFFTTHRGYTTGETGTGMEQLLNAMGYFVEFGKDPAIPSFFPASAQRWRWRLKEVRQSTEALQVFSLDSSSAWIQQLVSSESTTPILAENVIALVVLPERAANDAGAALSQDYAYDSRDTANALTRHQLPPRLRVVLVAMDENSAQILANRYGTGAPVLVAPRLFQESTKVDTDLAALDASLTSQKINHRIYQREILLPSAAWSDTLSH